MGWMRTDMAAARSMDSFLFSVMRRVALSTAACSRLFAAEISNPAADKRL
jgi:hypothetical protein